MILSRKRGFALPTVLISSVIMLIVLLSSVATVAAIRNSLNAQYYNQLAKSASEAGLAYAEACMEKFGVTWSDNQPLGPNTNCSGVQLAGFSCDDNYSDDRCWVYRGQNIVSTFSVPSPILDTSGNPSRILVNGATQLIRENTNSVWRQYIQNNQLEINTPKTYDQSASIEILVVGGGGGGGGGENAVGDGGGGGGAGGVVYKNNYKITADNYWVVVGDGGAGAAGSSQNGVSGQDSKFDLLTAYGGGGGGREDGAGGNGGSGGGGGGSCSTGDHLGGNGVLGQGYNGGTGIQSSCDYRGGAGGGGYFSSGSNDLATGGGGDGGLGIAFGITGSIVEYAGGGGGGAGRNSTAGGGLGRANGGNGGSAPNGSGGRALQNTGSGGGGAANGTGVGGSGGSGVVIISYPTGSIIASGGTMTAVDGKTIHTFKSTSNFYVHSVGSWEYKRPITLTNSNATALTNYQVAVSPFNDASLLNNSGLVGSWHFNDFFGTSTQDMSGVGNHGTYAGSNYRSNSGRFGNSFRGSPANSSKVAIPYTQSLNITSAISIEAWVNYSSYGNREIVGRMDSGGENPVSYELLQSQDGKRITFRLWDTGPWNWQMWTTNTDLPLNTWHHVVATWDGSTVKIYVDGKLDMTPASFTGPLYSSSNELYIGGYKNNTYLFDGKIDEVKLYNRALTGPATDCKIDSSSEVCKRYGALGNPKIRSDYADIRFMDATGTIEYDYWQENDSKFWVKIPNLATGSTTINMHYGNPSASPASNGDDTFLFFDDFSGLAIDRSKWVELDVSNKINKLNGSGLALLNINSNWDAALISRLKFDRTVDLTMGGAFKAGDSVLNYMMVGWGNDQETITSYQQLVHGFYFRNGSTQLVYELGTYYAGALSYSAGSLNTFSVKLKAVGANYYNNGQTVYSGTGGSLTTSPMRVAIHQDNHVGTFYNIYVRKSSTTEPSATAPGMEIFLPSYISF